jgi:hypothetical protein
MSDRFGTLRAVLQQAPSEQVWCIGVGRGALWGCMRSPSARLGAALPEMERGGVLCGRGRTSHPRSVRWGFAGRRGGPRRSAWLTDPDRVHDAASRANIAHRLALWVGGLRCRDAPLPTPMHHNNRRFAPR